jgi:hypothetical protein
MTNLSTVKNVFSFLKNLKMKGTFTKKIVNISKISSKT